MNASNLIFTETNAGAHPERESVQVPRALLEDMPTTEVTAEPQQDTKDPDYEQVSARDSAEDEKFGAAPMFSG